MSENIKLTGRYKTKYGYVVVLATVLGKSPYKVVGQYKGSDGEWYSDSWDYAGRNRYTSALDLIPAGAAPLTLIETSKQYITTGGLPVRIYTTDGEGDYQVIGQYCSGNKWYASCWSRYGSYTEKDASTFNLVEVDNTREVEFVTYIAYNPKCPSNYTQVGTEAAARFCASGNGWEWVKVVNTVRV